MNSKKANQQVKNVADDNSKVRDNAPAVNSVAPIADTVIGLTPEEEALLAALSAKRKAAEEHNALKLQGLRTALATAKANTETAVAPFKARIDAAIEEIKKAKAECEASEEVKAAIAAERTAEAELIAAGGAVKKSSKKSGERSRNDKMQGCGLHKRHKANTDCAWFKAQRAA